MLIGIANNENINTVCSLIKFEKPSTYEDPRNTYYNKHPHRLDGMYYLIFMLRMK